MARQNFPQIMGWLEVYEGGFVDHPRDPGGATNRGVTQKVYDAFRRRHGQPVRSVKYLTDDEHDAIYFRQYWSPVRGDALPDGIDASVFDYGVHSGVSRAAKSLQRAVGVKADGVVGEITLAAVQEKHEAGQTEKVIRQINEERYAFVRRLSTFDVFGKGWTRRIMGNRIGYQVDDIGVIDRSIMLARGAQSNVAPVIPLPKASSKGKADEVSLHWLGGLIEAFAAFIETLLQRPSKGVS